MLPLLPLLLQSEKKAKTERNERKKKQNDYQIKCEWDGMELVIDRVSEKKGREKRKTMNQIDKSFVKERRKGEECWAANNSSQPAQPASSAQNGNVIITYSFIHLWFSYTYNNLLPLSEFNRSINSSGGNC